MRQIKFRAWDLDKKEMYVPVIDSEGKSALLWYGYEIQGQTDDPIMQFTGLKDKNGKDIYEGDVFDLCRNDEEENLYFVEYKNDRFWLSKYVGHDINKEGSSDGYYRICLPAYTRDQEIIGNIYQNPELLEKNNGTK